MKTSLSQLEEQALRNISHHSGLSHSQLLLNKLLFRCTSELRLRINNVLAPFGLNFKQYTVLLMLYNKTGGAFYPSEISTVLDFTRVQVSRLLEELERKKWLIRTLDTQDKRRFILTLTESGTDTIRTVLPVIHRFYANIFTSFNMKESQALITLLGKLYQTLDNATDHDQQ